MTETQRFRPFVAVYLILVKDERVLLSRRFNSGYQDGNYGLPSGHVEESESAIAAVLREAKEETNIDVPPDDVTLAHTMYRRAPSRVYLDLFFVARQWSGDLRIMETNKCDALDWFPLNHLPKKIVPEIRQALVAIQRGQPYSEFGW